MDLGSKPKLFEKEEIIQKSFISANFANRPSISWKSLGTSKTLKNIVITDQNFFRQIYFIPKMMRRKERQTLSSNVTPQHRRGGAGGANRPFSNFRYKQTFSNTYSSIGVLFLNNVIRCKKLYLRWAGALV